MLLCRCIKVTLIDFLCQLSSREYNCELMVVKERHRDVSPRQMHPELTSAMPLSASAVMSPLLGWSPHYPYEHLNPHRHTKAMRCVLRGRSGGVRAVIKVNSWLLMHQLPPTEFRRHSGNKLIRHAPYRCTDGYQESLSCICSKYNAALNPYLPLTSQFLVW